MATSKNENRYHDSPASRVVLSVKRRLSLLRRTFNFPPLYLFDTSVLVAKPKFLKLNNRRYFVTEVVRQEIQTFNKQVVPNDNVLDNHTLDFESLRKKYPAICPVYYNLISSMHNPANILSPAFIIELVNASRAQGGIVAKEMHDLRSKIMEKLNNGAVEKQFAGRKKPDMMKLIDESVFKWYQKKGRSATHP